MGARDRVHEPARTQRRDAPAQAKRGGIAGRRRQRAVQLAFLLPAAVYLVPFFGFPVVKNILMGFQHYTTKTFFTGSAPWAGWANYATVIHASVFRRTVIGTVLFTVGSIVGQFLIGLAIACFFNRRFRSAACCALALSPWLIPLIASSAVWRWILDQDNGALNQFLDSFI